MRKTIAVVGPTASGKSKFAVQLAGIIGGEIVSADSRQIYKGIPVASNIIPLQERKGITHHFIEQLDLQEEFAAGEYARQAGNVINKIFEKGKIPVICGGSGLYIKALIDGFFEGNFKDNEIRKKLKEELREKGKEYLYDKLKQFDPETAEKITPAFSTRIMRALEVYYLSGKKISELQKINVKPDFETVQIGLNWNREKLYKRINDRVDEMIKNGLLEEVKILKVEGYHYSRFNSLNTVGVKEVLDYLDGYISETEMIELIKRNTRRYAKRQLTWFNTDVRIQWIEMNEKINPFETETVKSLIKEIKSDIS